MKPIFVPDQRQVIDSSSAVGAATLKVEHLSKRFGATPVLDDVSFETRRGELISLLGPSGSGKTTILRIVGGFEEADSGRVILNGRDVLADPPYKRNIGFVFQRYALFPHMTALQNVEFPLRRRAVALAEVTRRARDVLDLVGLRDLANRYPTQLSGGQQQRVALARAIVFEPEILLLDEPLGALDKQLRQRMQTEIRTLQQRLGITTVLVTHDQDEAMSMSDRIAVINQGRIEQISAPSAAYEEPESRFVADFLGESNIIEGVVSQSAADQVIVGSAGGHLVKIKTARHCGDRLLILVRPEKISISPASHPVSAENVFPGTVRHAAYFGDATTYSIDIGFAVVTAKISAGITHLSFVVGQPVLARWAADDAVPIKG